MQAHLLRYECNTFHASFTHLSRPQYCEQAIPLLIQKVREINARPRRELGSASTWSLDRLDALAAEASALFRQRALLQVPPRALESQAVDLQPKPSRKGSLSASLSSAQPLGAAGAMVRSSRGAEGRKERAVGETPGQQRNRRRKNRPSRRRGVASQSSADLAAAPQVQPPLMPKPAKQQRAASGQERDQSAAAGPGSKRSSGSSRSSLQNAMPLHGKSPEFEAGSAATCSLGDAAVCQFPMHALTAINDVLFGRHGYRRMALHGDPRQVHLFFPCKDSLYCCHSSLSLRHTTHCMLSRLLPSQTAAHALHQERTLR